VNDLVRALSSLPETIKFESANIQHDQLLNIFRREWAKKRELEAILSLLAHEIRDTAAWKIESDTMMNWIADHTTVSYSDFSRLAQTGEIMRIEGVELAALASLAKRRIHKLIPVADIQNGVMVNLTEFNELVEHGLDLSDDDFDMVMAGWRAANLEKPRKVLIAPGTEVYSKLDGEWEPVGFINKVKVKNDGYHELVMRINPAG